LFCPLLSRFRSMRYLLAVMLIILSGCVPRTQPTQGDLLDEITRPKHRLSEVDKAVAALADVPRPWAVEEMIELYAYEKDPKRKAHILWILAASSDPRGVLVLGESLTDGTREAACAAANALADSVVEIAISGGNDARWWGAHEWWKKNRPRVVAEARKLIEKNAGPGGVATNSFLWQLTLPPKEEITFRGRPIRFRDVPSAVMTWEITFKRSDGSLVKGLLHGSRNDFFSVMGLMDYRQIQSVRDFSRFPVFHIRGKQSDVVPDAWDVVSWGIPRFE